MRPLYPLAVAGVVALLAGCAAGPRATLPQLQHRAAYDLQCPAAYLRLSHVDKRTKIVSGCGKNIVYMEDCMEHGSELLCSWRVDSPAAGQVAQGAPQTAPGGAQQAGTITPRTYRTELYRDDYRHLEHRTTPTNGRPMGTDLYGGGTTTAPVDILEGRE